MLRATLASTVVSWVRICHCEVLEYQMAQVSVQSQNTSRLSLQNEKQITFKKPWISIKYMNGLFKRTSKMNSDIEKLVIRIPKRSIFLSLNLPFLFSLPIFISILNAIIENSKSREKTKADNLNPT